MESLTYTLMHKEVPVLDFSLDDYGNIAKVLECHNPQHTPIGITTKDHQVIKTALNSWMKGQSIPASRQNIQEALRQLHMDSTEELIHKCFGLSLSDQYWYRPSDLNIRWKKINFFENDFSETVGDILVGQYHPQNNESLDLVSPDNTSDGWLLKRWKILNGKRILLKGGSGTEQQQPFNEEFASKMASLMGVPAVPYVAFIQGDRAFSACENFLDTQTELIAAKYVMEETKPRGSTSNYQHYLDCCTLHGLDVRRSVDQMIVLDYLILNEDRHYNNFGIVRNADSLNWVSAAPIYDSGTSLLVNTPTSELLRSHEKAPSRTFRATHQEQIKLMESFDWMNTSCLKSAAEVAAEVFQRNPFLPTERYDKLCRLVDQQQEALQKIALEKDHLYSFDLTKTDSPKKKSKDLER